MGKYLYNEKTGRLTEYSKMKAKDSHLSPIDDRDAERVREHRRAEEAVKLLKIKGVKRPMVIEGVAEEEDKVVDVLPEVDADDLDLDGLEDGDDS